MMTMTIPYFIASTPYTDWPFATQHGSHADAIRYRRSARKRAKLRARRGKK